VIRTAGLAELLSVAKDIRQVVGQSRPCFSAKDQTAM